MLIRKINSVIGRKVRRLVFVFVVVCLGSNAHGQVFENEYRDIGGSEYRRKGCTFSMAPTGGYDTISIVDPISGEEITKTRLSGPVPATMNARKIYRPNEVTTLAQTNIGTRTMEEYLLDNLKETIRMFGVDSMTIQIKLKNIIVDAKGLVVYYEYEGVKGWRSDEMIRTLNSGSLGDKIESLMGNLPTLKPAIYNGMAVPAYTSITLDYYEIELLKPKVTYRKTPSKHLGHQKLYGMTK